MCLFDRWDASPLIVWHSRGMRALILVLSILVTAPAAAGTLVLSYEIAAGGLPAATANLTVTPDGERFRMSMRMETVGIIGFLTGFVATGRTLGEHSENGPRPLSHRVDNLWRGEKRMAEGHWSPMPTFILDPPIEHDDERPPVPEALQADTIDPLTAGLAMAHAAAAHREPALPVFDGRRRYDLTVLRLGRALVDSPVYTGPATLMTVRWTRLAGFAKPGWFAPSKLPDTARLWWSPPRPETLDLAVPVRVESEGPFGAVVVLLVGVAVTP